MVFNFNLIKDNFLKMERYNFTFDLLDRKRGPNFEEMKPLSFIVLAVMLLTIQSVVCDDLIQEKNAMNATTDARSGRCRLNRSQ